MRRRISRDDIRSATSKTFVEPLAIRVFARPIAELITPYFYNSGWTANAVTYLCASLSFGAIAALFSSYPIAINLAAILFYLVIVLD